MERASLWEIQHKSNRTIKRTMSDVVSKNIGTGHGGKKKTDQTHPHPTVPSERGFDHGTVVQYSRLV